MRARPGNADDGARSPTLDGTPPRGHTPHMELRTATTAALAHAFDLGTPVGAATLADHGERGRVWRLTTQRGTWAIKQALDRLDEARASADIAFQEAAAAAGISLPRPVRTRDGAAVLGGATLPGTPGGAFRVAAWVDLDGGSEATAEDFGRVAAALHGLDLPAAPESEPWWGPAVGLPEWAALIDAGRAGGEPWAAPLESALPDVVDLAGIIRDDDPADLRTCHRDLSVLNVRRTRDGSLVVLDWDNSGPAVPARELAVLLVVMTLQRSVDAAVAVYDAYRAAGGPARIRALTDFSSVARGVHGLVHLYATQALDPAAPADRRTFARERIQWVLSGPMLPTMTTLLDRLGDRSG